MRADTVEMAVWLGNNVGGRGGAGGYRVLGLAFVETPVYTIYGVGGGGAPGRE